MTTVMQSQTPVEPVKAPASIPKVPVTVILGLVLAIVLDTLVQILWKYCVLQVPADAGLPELVLKTASQPLFWLTITLFITQFVNWMTVLAKADLSYAQPITALSYVTVGIVSVLFLHESVTLPKIIGVLMILAGVWFITRTNHDTHGVAEK